MSDHRPNHPHFPQSVLYRNYTTAQHNLYGDFPPYSPNLSVGSFLASDDGLDNDLPFEIFETQPNIDHHSVQSDDDRMNDQWERKMHRDYNNTHRLVVFYSTA